MIQKVVIGNAFRYFYNRRSAYQDELRNGLFSLFGAFMQFFGPLLIRLSIDYSFS
jgi:hypothetical protein